MADLLQVSTLCLTYTPQRDVPPPLVAEAKQCKLPVANKSAFPLVMRTGQGGMRAATALELADMCVAMGAIMDWDKRIDEVESEDEVTSPSPHRYRLSQVFCRRLPSIPRCGQSVFA